MKKIIAYHIVEDESAAYFLNKVHDHIADGWQPFHGVATAVSQAAAGGPAKIIHTQAMVKYEE